MSSDVVIRAEGLGKKYMIGHQSGERYTSLRDVMAQSARNFARTAGDMFRGKAIIAGDEVEEFWALKDVSFEIKRGDVVGIIGRNGAGKSTLLKVLSRITEPSEGRVEIKGRVASLLEVGTGFHPELTGRENIYLNGAILGMSREEIKRKFDEIVDFSGVEKFLDTPVKRYSSGMYVRLAFAVAAHLEPEILIVDEVLAVGDAEFQKKCLGKMEDVAGQGRTVLFVSHNIAAISTLCKNGIVLSAGRLTARGSVDEAIASYIQASSHLTSPHEQCGNLRLGEIVLNPSKDDAEVHGTIQFEMICDDIIRDFCILLYGAHGTRLAIADMRAAISLPQKLSAGQHQINFKLSPLRLVEGVYEVGLYLVTDSFAGNVMNCGNLECPPASGSHTPYPVEHRGFFDINVSGCFT